MPERGVIYTRVSTADQVENYSLETQQQACETYCASRGIQVVRVFSEQGASAASTNRPQLKEMLYFCAQERDSIDYVIVHRLDRFARDVRGHMVVREALSELGVTLRAVQGGL